MWVSLKGTHSGLAVMATLRPAVALAALTWLCSFHVVNSYSARQMCPSSVPARSALRLYRGRCYEFINVERYWDGAQRDCNTKGGNLIKITDSETQDFVMAALKDLSWNRNGLWLGAHDITKEGAWQWVTGEAVTWSNWEDGQPSCYLPALKVFCAENCAVLRFSEGGKWHDYRCHSPGFTYSYICEYRFLRNPPPVTSATRIQTTSVNQTLPTDSPNITSIPSSHTVYTSGRPEGNQTLWVDTTTEVTRSNTSASVYGNEETSSIDDSLNSTDDNDDLGTTRAHDAESTMSTDKDTESENVTKSQILESSYSDAPVTSPEITDKTTNATAALDYIDIVTKSPVEETTDIIIGKYGHVDDGNYQDYDYNMIPGPKSAHTNERTPQETQASAAGPAAGAIVGACLLLAILLSAYYLHRKSRSKQEKEEWSVGFDNPNYGSQEGGNQPGTAEDESPIVNVFPPERPATPETLEDYHSQDMRGACCKPDACGSSAVERQEGNHYVSLDLADGQTSDRTFSRNGYLSSSNASAK